MPHAEHPTVATVADGLHVVRMPLPMRVEPVNCYIGEGPDGLTIVDTGMAIDVEARWEGAVDQLGLRLEDVTRILITHFHPDHIGASRALSELCQAPVLASAITVQQSPGVWGASLREYHDKMRRHLLTHGMPGQLVEQLDAELPYADIAVQIAPLEVLEQHAPFVFAGASWVIVPTPGHADGHVSLYDAAAGRLIAGDHLLQRISPAVGRFPDHAADPLGSYLDSLARIEALAPETVFPGHGAPFSDGAGRCRDLVDHHERRMIACVEAVAAGAVSTHDVAIAVFGDHHDPMNERFAVTETLAHLIRAQARGLVVEQRDAESLVDAVHWLLVS